MARPRGRPTVRRRFGGWGLRRRGCVARLAALGVGASAVLIIGCGQLARRAADAAGAPPGAHRLASELAVLRRAQTAQDRLSARVAQTLPRTIIPSLTRLVATGSAGRAGGLRVYLVVLAIGRCGNPSPGSGRRVSLITVTASRPEDAVQSMTFSAAELQRFAIIPVGSGEYYSGAPRVLSSVIPDGVARVKWMFKRVPHPGGAKHPRVVTVYPKVRDNVAVSRVATWETQSSATLYFADGRVLTSNNEATDLPACPAPKVVLGATNPIAPWLKHHFVIFRTSLDTAAIGTGRGPRLLLHQTRLRAELCPGPLRRDRHRLVRCQTWCLGCARQLGRLRARRPPERRLRASQRVPICPQQELLAVLRQCLTRVRRLAGQQPRLPRPEHVLRIRPGWEPNRRHRPRQRDDQDRTRRRQRLLDNRERPGRIPDRQGCHRPPRTFHTLRERQPVLSPHHAAAPT